MPDVLAVFVYMFWNKNNFVIDASDLKAITAGNLIPKYADDAYLIVPPQNAHTIELELQGISSWASQNNLSLNYTKSHHIVFRRPRFPRDHDTIAKVDTIQRVFEINILGVTISDTLTLATHVSNLSAKCAQLSFALKTLRSHGLAGAALWEVTRAHIINRLTYASSAWWDFCGTGEKEQLGAIVT